MTRLLYLFFWKKKIQQILSIMNGEYNSISFVKVKIIKPKVKTKIKWFF
jgi:hypothetical protein